MSTRTGMKIYGTFNGISPEAFERLKPLLNFDEVEYGNGTVTIAHDGYHATAEDLVPVISEAMNEGHESGLDIIDHDENRLIRYAIEADGFRCREMNIDDVVTAYPHSQG